MLTRVALCVPQLVHETAPGGKRAQMVEVSRSSSNDATIRVSPELHTVGVGGSGRGQLHVTVNGKHAQGSPYPVTLQPAKWIWNQLSKSPAEGSADRYTPIYGEINETGVAKILNWWQDKASLGEESVFMEAGCANFKCKNHDSSLENHDSSIENHDSSLENHDCL